MSDALVYVTSAAAMLAGHWLMLALARRGWVYWPGAAAARPSGRAATQPADDPVRHHVLKPAVVLRDTDEAADALDALRRVDRQQPAYVYVVDRTGRLRGVVATLRLLSTPLDTALGLLLEPRLFCVSDTQSMFDAASMLRAHRLRALPVTDPSGRLLGIVAAVDGSAGRAGPP